MLQTVPNIHNDIIAIVYEHHENSIGLGFPRKLRELRMNPLARVVALANAFVDLIMPTSKKSAKKSVFQAIYHLEAIQGRPYHRDADTAATRSGVIGSTAVA